MIIAKLEPSCRVWLITSQDSAKVHEIERDTAVHLSMQRNGETYLSVDGHAEIVDDRETIKDVWDEAFAPWFPQGADDSNIALIAVTPKRAEYWDHRDPGRSGTLDPTEAFIHGTKPE
jgi:general stress protein 26